MASVSCLFCLRDQSGSKGFCPLHERSWRFIFHPNHACSFLWFLWQFLKFMFHTKGERCGDTPCWGCLESRRTERQRKKTIGPQVASRWELGPQPGVRDSLAWSNTRTNEDIYDSMQKRSSTNDVSSILGVRWGRTLRSSLTFLCLFPELQGDRTAPTSRGVKAEYPWAAQNSESSGSSPVAFIQDQPMVVQEFQNKSSGGKCTQTKIFGSVRFFRCLLSNWASDEDNDWCIDLFSGEGGTQSRTSHF